MQCAVPICTCAEIPAGRVLLRVITDIICTYSVYNRTAYNFRFPETYHTFAENYEPIRQTRIILLLLSSSSILLYCAQVHYRKNMNGIHGALLRTCCTGAVRNNKLLSYGLYVDYTWFVRGSIIRKIQVNRR